MILEEAPGIPEEGEISTPETLPCNAPDKLVLAPFRQLIRFHILNRIT